MKNTQEGGVQHRQRWLHEQNPLVTSQLKELVNRVLKEHPEHASIFKTDFLLTLYSRAELKAMAYWKDTL